MRAAEGVLATMIAAMYFLVYPIFLTFRVTIGCQNDVHFSRNRKVIEQSVDFGELADRRRSAPGVVPVCDRVGVCTIRGETEDGIQRGDSSAVGSPSHGQSISGNNRPCCG